MMKHDDGKFHHAGPVRDLHANCIQPGQTVLHYYSNKNANIYFKIT